MSAAPVVVAALRTPIGTAGRSLAALSASDLAAPVLAALSGAVADLGRVDEVVLGNCMGPGGNLARVASLQAGLGLEIPALTVDRQCASGLAALVLAVQRLAEEPGLVVAGGVESASTAPWRFWPPQAGEQPVRYERAPFAPDDVGDPEMGVANDLLAAEAGVCRQAQDAYAARSHARASAAQREGRYRAEIVAVGGRSSDERPRAGLTAARLSRLPAVYRTQGTVTVGNACGINDGAAALALVDAEAHRRSGRPGLRVLATATTAGDPNRPGRALVPAARKALARAGVGLDELAVVELNEAFAGQVLACCSELRLDPERVCPEGGALALGHPWGASGAVLVVRLFSQLVLGGAGRYGLAAIAAGGGQGVAVVVEAVGVPGEHQ